MEPDYLGSSVAYARWFKQLRRLQSYLQAVAKGSSSPEAQLHRAELRRSIVHAAGFAPCFVEWWSARVHSMVGDPEYIPWWPPSAQVAGKIFAAFQAEVKTLGDNLMQQKKVIAAQRRREKPALVMRDVRREQPAPVDVLLNSQVAVVEEVRADEGMIVLDKPLHLDTQRPVIHKGQPLSVIRAEEDGVWAEECGRVEPGDVIRQDKFVDGLSEMFSAFGTEWKKRWCKHEEVPDSRWDQARQIVQLLPHLPVDEVEDITPSQLRKAVKSKKVTAATGLDAVGRQDVMQMSDQQLHEIAKIFQRVEAGEAWPDQLVQGSVASLEKRRDASTVGHYRPICVFPLLYRVWSTIRARPITQRLASIAASGHMGNMPRKHAAMVWYRIQESVQTAHMTQMQVMWRMWLRRSIACPELRSSRGQYASASVPKS